jgi:hypothetical protein
MPKKPAQDWTVWEAESIRMTAFPVPATTVTGYESWWSATNGAEPETVTNQAGAGKYQAVGVLKARQAEYSCALSYAPDRIDWLLGPYFSQNTFDLSKFTLGPVEEPWTLFHDIASSWLEKLSPRIARLAFGAVLVMRVPDRQAGYAKLNEYLPAVELDPVGSSDFFYSINRPRKSKSGVHNLEINRLSNWSVGHISPVQIQLTSPGGAQVTGIPSALSVSICRLECDINTKPESIGELPRGELVNVFGEMMEFGKELAQRGDLK